jgi:hypothetical protein
MKKYLVNYSDKTHQNAQIENSNSATSIGGFDEVFSFNLKDLGEDFVSDNIKIMSQPRGAGYWMWKPFVIKKALDLINDDDILMYSDSGISFIRNIDELVDIMDNTDEKLLLFELEDIHPNKRWTKRDCFVYMGLDDEPYLSKNQLLASYILMRKNDFVINFINEWLHYAKDYRVITDSTNECGLLNYPEFVDHRHDQSILSLLGRKYKIKNIPDVSQFGNGRMVTSQVFNHHRNRS